MEVLEKIVKKLSSAVGIRKRLLKKTLSYPLPCTDDKMRYAFSLGVRHASQEFLNSVQFFENIVYELKEFVKDGKN